MNCKEEAAKINEAIPYCLFVSFEVAEGFNVDLYDDVSAKSTSVFRFQITKKR